jgi:DNA helicase-2/ATP-dependent DNA helicase PcrA
MFADKPLPISAGVRNLMERIVRESGLEAMYRKIDKDAEEQVANISELISSAAEFDAGNPEGTLSEYLAGIALVADADHMEGAGGAVTMMTLHAAKGLSSQSSRWSAGRRESCRTRARAAT